MLEESGEVQFAFYAENARYLTYRKRIVNTKEYCASLKKHVKPFLDTKAQIRCLGPSDRLVLFLLPGMSRPARGLRIVKDAWSPFSLFAII